VISECGSGGKESVCNGDCLKCELIALNPKSRQKILEMTIMKSVKNLEKKLPFEFTCEDFFNALRNLMDLSNEFMKEENKDKG
jgi:hypothetical protein